MLAHPGYVIIDQMKTAVGKSLGSMFGGGAMTSIRITQLANKYLNYDMINLHTELPQFPDGRISLLYAVLSQQPAAESNKELLALVTSLVQMGLDTHDLVDNGNADSNKGLLGMRTQQLKVLAGDYFSSRFYHLLSQAGQIDTIR